MKTPPKNKGGRTPDNVPFYFILMNQRPASWYYVFKKFGHLGTATLLAMCEYMSKSKHFQLQLDVKFYAILERDHNIDIEQFKQIIEYAITEVGLYDQFLYERGSLFSLELLRNYNNSGYFRNRKYKASDILSAINFIREGQKPLTLEDEFEEIMNSLGTSSKNEDDYDEELPF
jgi:hypothetical protein